MDQPAASGMLTKVFAKKVPSGWTVTLTWSTKRDTVIQNLQVRAPDATTDDEVWTAIVLAAKKDGITLPSEPPSDFAPAVASKIGDWTWQRVKTQEARDA